MLANQFDIDIDISPKSCPDKSKYGTRAMVYNEDQKKILPHPSGVYMEKVPVDLLTGLCSFDYEYGEEHGYIKVDLLNNTSYDMFDSKDQLVDLSKKEPNWELLKDREVVKKLPQLANQVDVVVDLDIHSIQDLADVLALIRPGKIHYFEKYKKNKESVRRNLYKRSSNGKPYFKKSHAFSYAVMIVAILNKMDLFGIRGKL